MGLSEMLEKSNPVQAKRQKENASAFKSLANRNVELIDENKELKEKINNAIELVKSLIIFWKKYSPDNTIEIGQFENILSILQGSDKE